MKDPLGDRMKRQYEDRFRIMLPRRTYTILRLDGKAFHTLTATLAKPFDAAFMEAMKAAAIAICEEAQGADFAYVQSDEISVLLTDFENPQTEAWFDGNLQKMVSVSAAIASTAFTEVLGVTGLFDSRAFIIPDPVEVENYFLWRQRDCTNNSQLMVAQTIWSHKELEGKGRKELAVALETECVDWTLFPSGAMRGNLAIREIYTIESAEGEVLRSRWKVDAAFDFGLERAKLTAMIPRMA